MANWVKEAVFYEIYPQSFYDSNGDGIGDIPGIIQKLDYIRELGCNALWINPCYDSPFKDAGYDVRDYKKVAARYGTNEDLYRLFSEAHQKGIHVLLDLVPGHTSEEHEWFVASQKQEPNQYSGRYIWSDFWLGAMPGHPYIAGESERNGTYMLNFFKCQPALNYGFYKPVFSWQKSMDDPDCLATREAIKDVMRFWLAHGCDGFRVDMADSLVKEDTPDKAGTCEVWRDILGDIRREFPEAAFVSEWSNPQLALLSAGFDMDFYLDHPGNGYHTLLRDGGAGGEDNSYFRSEGKGDITRFLVDYLPKYEVTKEKGYISFLTCNHDTPRASRTLSVQERKVAYGMLFTVPGVPFLYYGDEIGMRYIENLPTKEGGYTRTGSRTPMQWGGENGVLKGREASDVLKEREAGEETGDALNGREAGEGTCDEALASLRNLGFSEADPEKLYLPVDPAADAPTVSEQEKDPNSLYSFMRRLLHFRAEQPSFRADAEFEVIVGEKGKPFVYRRGNLYCLVNPSLNPAAVSLPEVQDKRILFTTEDSGAMEGGCLFDGMVPAQAFLVVER